MTDTSNTNNSPDDSSEDMDLTQGNLENDENLQTGDTDAGEPDLDDPADEGIEL